jgi:hypothetical protein
MRFLLAAAFTLLGFSNLHAQDFVYRNDGPKHTGWIKEVKDSKGLKVMFWNVACIISQKKLKDYPQKLYHNEAPKNLIKNIKNLIASDDLRPDVFIFGEHCSRPFDEGGVSEVLDKTYSYKFERDRYNRFYDQDNGMTIYSRFKINNKKIVMLQSGSWMKDSDMVRCKKKYGKSITGPNSFARDSWDRPYLQFNVKKRNKTYNIVAVHLPNPWPLMAKCEGKVKTALKIWKGKNNPNYRQGNILANRYSKSSKRTLMIGDFNAPKRQSVKVPIIGNIKVTSHTYKRVSQSMGNSLIKSDRGTGIHQSGSMKTQTSIDHAFASKDLKVKMAKIVPFAGSDHLAIYTVLD